MTSPICADLARKLATVRIATLEAERMLDDNIGIATQERYRELVEIAAKAGAEYRLILMQLDPHWQDEAKGQGGDSALA